MSPTNTKLAIFPASGGLGGATLEHLLKTEKADPKDVVLIARTPERLAEHQKAGVEVRKANYDETETLTHAFDGVKVLNLISYASIEDDHRFNAHKLAIDAAIASGVSHVIYSSLGFGGLPPQTTSVAFVMFAHIRTELYLASLHKSNPSFTYSVIRQGLYAESFPLYTAFYSLSSPASDDKIKIPHSGSGPGVSWVKRDELGEATAKLLLQAFKGDASFAPYLNTTVLLSGAKEYSLSETAAILGKSIGRDVQVQEVSVEEYAKQPQVQEGLTYGGGEWAPIWATAFEGIKQNEASQVTGEMEKVLGRKPESFEATIEEMARTGRTE